ncbi:MAG TPA: VWA domain-containing protein [Terriglobales bacterium]|nr:VWA domain-containing protein [Terriglobales bacterium]
MATDSNFRFTYTILSKADVGAALRKIAIFLLAFTFFLLGCESKSSQEAPVTQAPRDALEIVLTYGSEKEKWITEVTDKFNQEDHRTSGGKRIFVHAFPMGSGESIDEVLSGNRKADMVSPASAAFIKLGNAQSQSKTGKDLITSTDNLVLSPVVIAMWKPMAEALGWGKKPIGWADILALARNQKGWQAYGYPQWGQFKFGHTHPQFSNSGLISLFAEVYAASGKTAGLTLADVQKPHTADFVSGIEGSIVHYGSSTGFFGRKMFASGPQYLSAAVLYENMVIESYGPENHLPFPVVAIYPKEGTFWSDHPIGVVEREWVTPEHREASKVYIQYLLQRPQQERAIAYGFRPGAVDVPLASPIDSSHGVDPKEPKTTLEVPSVQVIDAILKLWDQKKKGANVVLVLDTSGSMNDEDKIQNAREGAKQLVNLLSPGDTLSLFPFNSTGQWAATDVPIKDGKDKLIQQIDSLFAQGGTALYDSVDTGYQHLMDQRQSGHDDHILSVIVLTDGEDTDSKMKLDELMQHIKFDGETHNIHVFTIAYGKDARKDVLQQIADGTQAKAYEGTPQNIVEVFKDISTFF